MKKLILFSFLLLSFTYCNQEDAVLQEGGTEITTKAAGCTCNCPECNGPGEIIQHFCECPSSCSGNCNGGGSSPGGGGGGNEPDLPGGFG